MQTAANSLETVLSVHVPSPRFPNVQCVCGGRVNACSEIRMAYERAGQPLPETTKRRSPSRRRASV